MLPSQANSHAQAQDGGGGQGAGATPKAPPIKRDQKKNSGNINANCFWELGRFDDPRGRVRRPAPKIFVLAKLLPSSRAACSGELEECAPVFWRREVQEAPQLGRPVQDGVPTRRSFRAARGGELFAGLCSLWPLMS
jgi:hypothetical protein